MTRNTPVKLMRSLHITTQYSKSKCDIWSSNSKVDKLPINLRYLLVFSRASPKFWSNRTAGSIGVSTGQEPDIPNSVSKSLRYFHWDRERETLWRPSNFYLKEVKMTKILHMKMSAYCLDIALRQYTMWIITICHNIIHIYFQGNTTRGWVSNKEKMIRNTSIQIILTTTIKPSSRRLLQPVTLKSSHSRRLSFESHPNSWSI